MGQKFVIPKETDRRERERERERLPDCVREWSYPDQNERKLTVRAMGRENERKLRLRNQRKKEVENRGTEQRKKERKKERGMCGNNWVVLGF